MSRYEVGNEIHELLHKQVLRKLEDPDYQVIREDAEKLFDLILVWHTEPKDIRP